MIAYSDINLENCNNLKSLGKLKSVIGNLELSNCENLEDLGNLEEVKGKLNLKTLGNLKTIKILYYGKNLPMNSKFKASFSISNIFGKNIEDLGKIEILQYGINLISLNNIKRIKYLKTCESINIINCYNLISFDNLTTVNGDFIINYSKRSKNLKVPKLKYVYGTFKPTNIYDLSSVEEISGDLNLYYYKYDKIKLHPNLKIGGKILINFATSNKLNLPERFWEKIA